MRLGERFYVTHGLLPLASLVLGAVWAMGWGGDQLLADTFYRLEGGRWALKNAWLMSQVIHRWGRTLSVIGGALVISMAILGWCSPARARWRGPATYVAASVIVATSLIWVLKHVTGMDCPWDLSRYGGQRPLLRLWQSRHGLPASGCFPAGHAGAGYAWVAWYFAAWVRWPHWRWFGLTFGVGLGLLFGICQQLRGAHFLSHDLWALAICWFVALLLFLGWMRAVPNRQPGA